MNICRPCLHDQCNECVDAKNAPDDLSSTCDCGLAAHTVAPAHLIQDALVAISDGLPLIIASGLDCDDLTSTFAVELTGRLFRVEVRAVRQGDI